MTRRQVAKLLSKFKAVRLDLGCGRNKQDGFFGVDLRAVPGVDLVHDLVWEMPWPIPDSVASTVVMSHFWEHIPPWKTLPFMAELHRVCRDGCQVMIAAPHGVEYRFVQDPTHCNPSNEATFHYWDPEKPLYQIYEPPPFKLEYFEVFPAGTSRDFNAILRCIKKGGAA